VIGTFLFVAFVMMLLGGVPIAVALGLAGTLAIWFGGQSIMAVPTNVYTGIAKYPLIAIPMFVLVGSVFDRTGVALRLVRFATALVGAGRGALATVAMIVAMIIGGISGLGPATSAAVGGVVTPQHDQGRLSAPVHRQAWALRRPHRHSHSRPSIAFIIYAVMTPGVSVPAIFAAGMFPGILAGTDDADPDRRDLDHEGFRRQGGGERAPASCGRASRKRSGACSRRS
jgi:TRAP-type mannitol/chloroaromatic compound transport system permease large subunit